MSLKVGDFMKIKIMRRTALQDLSLKPFEERVAIISITSVHNPIVELKNMPQEMLRLSFDDLDNDAVADQLGPNPTHEHRKRIEEKYHMFSDEQAQQIAEFYNRVKGDVDTLICQCEYGQSRSAGVAAAIIEFTTRKGIRVFVDDRYFPNKFVFRKVFNALKEYRNGKL